MCGIAGIYHYAADGRPVDRTLVERMTRLLAHRGPDDEGFHWDGPIGLGHRRLSIVDLSATGNQPMATADGSCWISYNGEFYNHLEHRQRLAAKGCVFRGTSDTETLLYLLQVWGPTALADVAGIFAFAFWDAKNRRLILGRDPLGVKQLYYHDDGRRIVFASEIKALLCCPDVPREPDPEGVNQYLHFHTPLFERTFFKGIQQVRAGEYLEVNPAGPRQRLYWQLDGFEPRGGTAQTNISQLQGLLESVVGDQLMSDVPVGSFFSGGVDSCTVAAFAKRHGKRLRCFGVHFHEDGVIDERPYQESAAAALGLDLDIITLDGSTFPEDFLKLSYVQDQPVIGAAMLPMYAVSRLAASRVKVCLGGQAADEVFGGYARYALARPLRIAASWLHWRAASRGGSPATAASGTGVGGNLLKQLGDLRNIKRLAGDLGSIGNYGTRYFHHFSKVPARSWRRIFADEAFFSRARAATVFHDTLNSSAAADPADKLLHWDVQTYLTGLFQQDDRMSMAHSLESRVPLADPRLVRFAFHTPFDLKMRAGASKWLLRQAVADVIPREVLNRRKAGFDTPAETWMRDRHPGFVRELLLSSRARSRGFWSPKAVERLLDNTRHPHWFDMIWKLASVEAWASVFLDGGSAGAGGVENTASSGLRS
jgi:asparagine synthase (glutamine-hydrolysing)